jgi:hypothetical protein
MRKYNMYLKYLYLGLSLILLLSLVDGFPCSGGDYSVEKTSTLIVGGLANNSEYSARSAFAEFTGTNNIINSLFTGYIGVYNLSYIPVPEPSIGASSYDKFKFARNSTYFDESTREHEPIPFIGCGQKAIRPESGFYYVCNKDADRISLELSVVGYSTKCGDTRDFISVKPDTLYLKHMECAAIQISVDYPDGCNETFYDEAIFTHDFGVIIEGKGSRLFIPIETLSPKGSPECAVNSSLNSSGCENTLLELYIFIRSEGRSAFQAPFIKLAQIFQLIFEASGCLI